MPTTPYHVRLALSQYGEQFRAELFTEDLGDTDGDLLSELPPSLGEWIPFLAQGAELPPDAARKLGKDLFAALLGQPETGKKWTEVLAQAERQKRPVRLLIDATSEAVRDLPYGLMCEPHDDYFLFRPSSKQSVGLVRILRRCSPRTLKLRDRLKVLIAAAEPKSADVPAFDAPLRLKHLWSDLHDKIDLFVCGPDGPVPMTDAPSFAPYCATTRDRLKKSLLGDFDVVHLLAHGHGAGVLLCSATGTPVETTAGELGEWCGAGKTSLAFLQVCKAGQTADRGGFGGVAQQLLNPKSGNLAAVIASTFPLDAENSTDSAIGFYQQLAAGKPPEEALTWERPEADWCWAFLELWARPGALGGSGQRAAFQFVSPYRGLASFNEQDADLFFGRRTELTEVLQILRSEPAIAVVGDSGSGKTSLLQAGLIHAVRREGMAGKERWKIASLRPGYRPAQALLQALGASGEPTAANLAAALKVSGDPLLVVFDQFEEIFTLARDAAEVQLLTAALADAVTDQPDRFRLVLGMRSEFLGQAASVRGLSRLIRRPWVLRPPGSDDLREIVAGPAEHCGYTFQGPLADGDPKHAAGLLDRILADPLLARDHAGATSAPLPLLQFALERLWLRAVDKGLTEFTHAEFDEVGGMAKAIALHAEAVFQSVSTATGLGATARLLCEHLITALVSAKGTRQPRSRDALLAETTNPESARAVVDYLVGERLLTVRSDPEDLTIPLLDLAHEALILHWDRLRGWLSEDPQGRAMREEFRKATEQWAEGMAGIPPKSRRGLPGFDMANTFLVWVDNAKPKLGPFQTEFAKAIRGMLKRQKRVRRSVMTSLAGLTLAAMVLAVFAAIQRDEAKTSASLAKQREGEAIDSGKKAKDEEAKARISLYSRDIRDATDALAASDHSSLRKALDAAAPDLRGWEWHHLNAVANSMVEILPTPGAEGSLVRVEPSPDGHWVLGYGRDLGIDRYNEWVAVWDLAKGGKPKIFADQPTNSTRPGKSVGPLPDSVEKIVFFPDGKRALILRRISYRVWDLTAPEKPLAEGTLVCDARSFVHAAVSADGKRFGAVSFHLIPPPAGSPLDQGHSSETIARVYDIASGKPVEATPLADIAGPSLIGPEMDRVLFTRKTANKDGLELCEKTFKPERIEVLKSIAGRVIGLFSSPDGRGLLVAIQTGDAGTQLENRAELWADWRGSERRAVPFERFGVLVSATVFPNGSGVSLAASAPEVLGEPEMQFLSWIPAARQSIRKIRIESGAGLRGITRDWVYLTAPEAPNGSGSVLKRIRLSVETDARWIAEVGPNELAPMAMVAPTDRDVFWSDGNPNGKFHRADSTTARSAVLLPAPMGVNGFVQLAADRTGRRVLAELQTDPIGDRPVSIENLLVYDVAAGRAVKRFGTEFGAAIGALALSPDGATVAVGTAIADPAGVPADRIGVQLVSADTGTRLRVLPTIGAVRGIAFSLDGSKIAVSSDRDPTGSRESNRGTVTLWDARTGEVLWTTEFREEIYGVVFSPDGRRLAVTGTGELSFFGAPKKVHLLSAETGDTLRALELPTARLGAPVGLGFKPAFSPDGTRLVTPGNDAVTLWELTTYQRVATFPGGARKLQFTPDGQTLVGLGANGIWVRSAR